MQGGDVLIVGRSTGTDLACSNVGGPISERGAVVLHNIDGSAKATNDDCDAAPLADGDDGPIGVCPFGPL